MAMVDVGKYPSFMDPSWKKVPTPPRNATFPPPEIAGLINRGGDAGGYVILSGKISPNYSTMVVDSLNKALFPLGGSS